jgi:hypothetical protein
VEIDIIAKVDQAISGLESFITKIGAAYFSVQALKKVFVESFAAYQEAEVSQVKLGAALQLTGQYSKQSVEGFLEYSKALQMVTISSHESIESSAALLMEIGHLSIDGVKAILPHLQDYSAAMGIDLVTASQQAAQAIEGGRNVFQRFGISMKDAHDPLDRFDILVKGLATDFDGVAKAMANTTKGELTTFKNTVDEIKESLGGIIAHLMNPVLGGLSKGLQLREILKVDPKTIDDLNTLQIYMHAIAEQELYLNTQGAGKIGIKSMLEGLSAQFDALNARYKELEKLKTKATSPVLAGGPADTTDKSATDISSLQKPWTDFFAIQGKVSDGFEQYAKDCLAADQAMEKMSQDLTDKLQKPWTEFFAKQNEAKYESADFSKALKDEEDAARKLEDQVKEAGREIVKLGGEFGSALSTGDWKGFFQSIMADLAQLIEREAIAAAVTAAMHGDYVTMAFWLGIAGITAIGAGAISSMSDSSSSSSSSLPHYASGTDYVPRTGLAIVHQGEQIIPAGSGRGGGTINIHVYGGNSNQIARQVVSEMQRW